MATSLALSMQVTANTQGLAKATKDVEKLMKQMEKSVKDTQKELKKISLFTGFNAATNAAQVFYKSLMKVKNLFSGLVQATADQENELIRVVAVFGEASKAVEEFAKTTTQLGISEVQALRAAGSFGNLFTALGSGKEEAAGLSQTLTLLAADLAAFSNTSIDQALGAIQSGLQGQTRPLRAFQVNINAALLQTKAFEMGLTDTTTKALDPYQRSLATVALLLDQTVNAQGQAAREAEQYGTILRRVAAEISDVSGTLGKAFLPIFKAVAAGFLQALPQIKKFANELASAFEGVDWTFISASIATIITAFTTLARIVVGVVGPIIAFFVSMIDGAIKFFGDLGIGVEEVSAVFTGVFLTAMSIAVGVLATFVATTIFAAITAIPAFILSIRALIASIPVVGWAAALLSVLGTITAYWLAGDTVSAQKKAMDEQNRMYEEQIAKLDEIGKASSDARKATEEPFEFKINSFTNENVADSISKNAKSQFEKLAVGLGGIEKILFGTRKKYDELIAAQKAYNESPSTEGLKRVLSLSEQLTKEIEKQSAAMEKQKKKVETAADAYKKALEVVEKLVADAQTPSQNTAREYAEQMEAISLYLRKAQDDLNAARAAGNAAAITAAEKQLELAKKNTEIAAGQAEKQRKESYLENLGFNIDDFKEQTQEIDKLAAVVQEFNRGILTGSEVRNYVENTANDVIDWFRQIKEQTQDIADENLKAMDTRTAEGLEEFFRLASGQDDPSLEAEREQVAQLKKINKQLKGTGLTVAKIAGA